MRPANLGKTTCAAVFATLENHTVDFRGSADFQTWRGLVGQYFAAAPEVEHTETVVS